MDKNIEKELQEKSKDEKNKKRLLLIILSITTIIVALVGASFAYFAVTVKNLRGNESLVVEATVLQGVTYKASDNLALLNALPGDSADTTFTIANPNESAKVRYSLKFVADVNDFTNDAGDGQLLITISGGNINNDIVIDFTDGKNIKEAPIITNVELKPNESDVYKAKLEFAEIGKNQISNQEKTFVGHVEITQSIAVQ